MLNVANEIPSSGTEPPENLLRNGKKFNHGQKTDNSTIPFEVQLMSTLQYGSSLQLNEVILVDVNK